LGITYYAGEQLRFKLREFSEYNRGIVVGFKGDTIQFDFGEVYVYDIVEIDVRAKTNKGTARRILFSGFGFFVMDWANQKIQYGTYQLNRTVMATSGVLVASAGIFYLIKRKKFQPRGRRHLLIMG